MNNNNLVDYLIHEIEQAEEHVTEDAGTAYIRGAKWVLEMVKDRTIKSFLYRIKTPQERFNDYINN